MSKTATRRETFSTGDVARVCGLSQQTVVRAFDAGKLKGFLLPPDRKLRRCTRAQVEAFQREQGIPYDADGIHTG